LYLDCPKYTEDLTALSGFKVGIDADLLLSMCTKSSPHTSLQSANQSLDIQLQKNLIDILKTLNTKYQLELVIVMQGLKPPTLMNDLASLENSYHLWQCKDDQTLYQ
jgi:hypothetical protein